MNVPATEPEFVKAADLHKDPRIVSQMFDLVAERYDVTNDVLTAFQQRGWRRAAATALNAGPDDSVLDIAGGTGSSAIHYIERGAHVTAADFSPGMLAKGRERHPELEFVYADAMNLPFDDASFSATTISFGLRNISDPRRALAEMYRVTKPGGRVLVVEFSTPPNRLVRGVYLWFLRSVLPILATVTSSDKPAYEYLTDSIVDWPNQNELGRMISEAGFVNVRYRNLTLGVVAMHLGFKPERS
ncbi:MAG: class I SAM-dependent methyltransferase [Varibaculum sp.]|nr:class I SAM-dependent methyltransferase [Varibaculum sp.]